MGAMSVLIAGAALTAHFWVQNAAPLVVLLARIGLLLVPLVWAALTVADYRAERRAGGWMYGAAAGLALLAFATLGVTVAMIPGLIDSIGRAG